MDINSLDLSDIEIEALYKDSLVHIRDAPEYPVMIFLKTEKRMTGEQNKLLKNLTDACKLSDDSYLTKAYNSGDSFSIKDLKKRHGLKYVMVFGDGIPFIDLPIEFPHYQVQQFDGISYLSSPSLEELEKNKEFKKKLWLSLKKLFNL